MNDPTLFQYCQKLVVFRNNDSEVLLARRQGEADYDGTYTFIGGKMETTDGSIVNGLQREKNEEISDKVQLFVNPTISYNVHFIKKNGQHMILPHYYASYEGGEIILSNEYDDFRWVLVEELASFSPKVENVPEVIDKLLILKQVFAPDDFVTI